MRRKILRGKYLAITNDCICNQLNVVSFASLNMARQFVRETHRLSEVYGNTVVTQVDNYEYTTTFNDRLERLLVTRIIELDITSII